MTNEPAAPPTEQNTPIDWLWTWRGVSFGYRKGASLFTYQGQEVARFYGNDLFGIDGDYIGEVLREHRLVTRPTKRIWRKQKFVPTAGRAVRRFSNAFAHVMYSGYEDFPSPDSFHPAT